MAVNGNSDPEGDAAMKARLDALSGALDASRRSGEAQPKDDAAASGIGQAMNLGFRVMSEFVVTVAVGGCIGWAVDRGLHSSPVGLILFIALGTAAGFWNVYRIAARPTAPQRGGAPKAPPPSERP